MSDPLESNPPSVQVTQARIRDVAQKLRDSGTVGDDVKIALAELLDELSAALQTPGVPAPEVAHLADSAAHLAQTLHEKEDASLVTRARERLDDALLQAEVQAPNAVGLARSVIDALANIGI